MKDSDIIVPPHIGKILTERATLWQKFQEAKSQSNELDKLASRLVPSTPAQIPPELTAEGTPPAEVSSALQLLRREFNSILRTHSDIETYKAEIKRIERRQLILYMVIGLIIVVVLCIAAYVGITIVNTILSNISR